MERNNRDPRSLEPQSKAPLTLQKEKEGKILEVRDKYGWSKEQIEALMNFIDAKLKKNKGLKEAKLQLINCQLCSLT